MMKTKVLADKLNGLVEKVMASLTRIQKAVSALLGEVETEAIESEVA